MSVITQPEVSIITVGMNHQKFMEALLHSLFVVNRPQCSFEMIFVDNCSTDDSVSYIQNNFPQVKVIQNEHVKGFGANNNLGVKHALGKYIAIFNPDIQFLADSLDILLGAFIKLEKESVLVPKLLNPDFSLQFSARGMVDFQTFLARMITKANDDSNLKSVQKYLFKDIKSEEPQFVDWAVGAAFFTSRQTFDLLQGFDEDFFLYLEDTDFCLRAWKKDIPVIYLPKSVLIHNHLRGSAKIGGKTLMHLKSYFTYFRKNGLFPKSNKEKFDQSILKKL